MKEIKGGVCAAQGFSAAGIHCGLRKNPEQKDLALIFSRSVCTVSCVYTQNSVKGAPIVLTQKHCADHQAQAIICNSGNANAGNPNGLQIAYEVAALTAKSLGIKTEDVVVASTGVIGQPLVLAPFAKHIPQLVDQLSVSGNTAASEAILTTDTGSKEIALEFMVGDTLAHLGGMAKGSGMIHPNMATMLAFLTTDLDIEASCLQNMLKEAVNETFNMISIDGDTSTNDMVTILANGEVNNKTITQDSPYYETVYQALLQVCQHLAIAIVRDGEGASKLIACTVYDAETDTSAKTIAKGIIKSSLVKTAVFGRDANIGRILCAIGYSQNNVDVSMLDIYLRAQHEFLCICLSGNVVAFDEDKAYQILGEDTINIDVYLNQGRNQATAWGCDLTYDYVRINSEYRS